MCKSLIEMFHSEKSDKNRIRMKIIKAMRQKSSDIRIIFATTVDNVETVPDDSQTLLNCLVLMMIFLQNLIKMFKRKYSVFFFFSWVKFTRIVFSNEIGIF